MLVLVSPFNVMVQYFDYNYAGDAMEIVKTPKILVRLVVVDADRYWRRTIIREPL